MIKKIITHILFINVLIVLVVVLFLQYAVKPEIPQSVFAFYIIALVVGLILFVTSTTKNMREFWAPIKTLLTNERLFILRWLVMLSIPAVIAVFAGFSLLPSNQAPLVLRVIHPAPPGEINFGGKTINLRAAVNPYREYETADPEPANFQDVGTIAQLQETYVFWRVAKGGPGLPNESMPWQTAMPAWEGILSENDIWDVTLFLYKATNHPPRTWE